jgi:hypothetical protein
MAGSYSHIVNSKNEFRGIELIDNLGDAHEALEECYWMIWLLTRGDKEKIHDIHCEYLKKIEGSDYKSTSAEYWGDEDECEDESDYNARYEMEKSREIIKRLKEQK